MCERKALCVSRSGIVWRRNDDARIGPVPAEVMDPVPAEPLGADEAMIKGTLHARPGALHKKLKGQNEI